MFIKCLKSFILMLIIVNVAYTQDAFKNPKVIGIKFIGLTNTYPDEVKKLLGIKEGDIVTESIINDSLKNIFSLDLFSDSKIEVTELSNGLILTYVVKENEFIRTIKYEGNKSLRKDDLDKEIDFTENSYFTSAKLNRSIIAIQKKFEDEGFIDTKVTNSLKLINTNKNIYDLIFQVTEGKKIVIERIKITGNKTLKESDIKGVMKTKEKFLIFESGVLKEEEFEKDKDNIIMLYQHNGFMDVTVNIYKWKIEELGNNKHKGIVIYLDLTEGDKYFVGDITIKGNSIYTTNDLYTVVDMKKGEIYDKVKMDMIRYNMYQKYSDSGHLYANVSPVLTKSTNIYTTNINKISTNIESMVIDTELIITEGSRSHIEHITISGNTKTKANVIRREFEFKEGEIFVHHKVMVTLDRLNALQYFSDVKPNVLPGSAEGLVNIDIAVEEQRTGIVTFGLGYGTVSGFYATAQIAENNLLGTGRKVSIQGTYGQLQQGLSTSFTEPWLFDDPTSITVNLGFNRYVNQNIEADSSGNGYIDGTNFSYIDNPNEDITNYTNVNNVFYQNSLSLGFNIARRFFTYWTGSAGYYTSINWYYGATFNNPLIFDIGQNKWVTNTTLISYLSNTNGIFKNDLALSATRDTTDNPLNQTRGSVFKTTLYYYGGLVGGAINFIKPGISYDIYYNPFWKIVLAAHISTELCLPQFSINFNPFTINTNNFNPDNINDLEWFDGLYEMRGWQGNNFRGQGKAFYSGELRFQIYGKELWGAFFYDMGNVWGNYYEVAPFNPVGYIYSFGVGIKINIPMIPIRFYLARTGYYDQNLQRFQFMGGSQNLFWDLQPVFTIQGLF